jgi:hypothetical protein
MLVKEEYPINHQPNIFFLMKKENQAWFKRIKKQIAKI